MIIWAKARPSLWTVQSAAGDFVINTAGGDFVINTAAGDFVINTAGGDFVINTAGGDFVINTAAGDFVINTAGGDLVINTAGGDLVINTAGGCHCSRCDDVLYKFMSTSTLLSARLTVAILPSHSTHYPIIVLSYRTVCLESLLRVVWLRITPTISPSQVDAVAIHNTSCIGLELFIELAQFIYCLHDERTSWCGYNVDVTELLDLYLGSTWCIFII